MEAEAEAEAIRVSDILKYAILNDLHFYNMLSFKFQLQCYLNRELNFFEKVAF